MNNLSMFIKSIWFYLSLRLLELSFHQKKVISDNYRIISMYNIFFSSFTVKEHPITDISSHLENMNNLAVFCTIYVKRYSLFLLQMSL